MIRRKVAATVLLAGLSLRALACSVNDDDDLPQANADAGPNSLGSCKGLPESCIDDGPVSCCTFKAVPTGSFPMGRATIGSDQCPSDILCYPGELPEHDVTVSEFELAVFEVTVGRFRRFVDAYDGAPPDPGAGAHPLLEGSGWRPEWNVSLPGSKAKLLDGLHCDPKLETWTDAPAGRENAPMNCVSWVVAFAFCAWDEARLPTEAEWEYAAAGGAENRLYPWGEAIPTLVDAGADAEPTPPSDVGAVPGTRGRYGHQDLGRGLFEFTLDFYDRRFYESGGQGCRDCANLVPAESRVKRGGDWRSQPGNVRAAARYAEDPNVSIPANGFRCARSRRP